MATVNGVHYPVGSDIYDLPADWLLHAQTDAQQALDAAAAAVAGIVLPPAGLPYLQMPADAEWRFQPDGIYKIRTFAHAEGLTPPLPAEMLGAGVMRIMSPRETGPRVYEFISTAGNGSWVTYRDGAEQFDTWRRIATADELRPSRMLNGSAWRNLPDGAYYMPAKVDAETLTPPLPAELQAAFVMRIHTANDNVRLYEYISARGYWFASTGAEGFSSWQKIATTSDLAPTRLLVGASWQALPDGTYYAPTQSDAQAITPSLPAELQAAFSLRITSPNANVRAFEYMGSRGFWLATISAAGFSGWEKVATSADVQGMATAEDLKRFVIEGDQRLYDTRLPMDTDWIEHSTGLELRRVGHQCYARATGLAVPTGGVIADDLPLGFTPAAREDFTLTGTPAYADPTGLHLDSTTAATVNGVASWITDDHWQYE